MPTFIGHSISGIALSTFYSSKSHKLRVIILSIICSIIPDLDTIGFRTGIPYSHWLGHRGFSHSILFALVFALITTLFILNIEKSFKKIIFLYLTFLSCTLSHIALDALTNGGLGVALLWPFNNKRFFFPWRPIEVSPISIRRFLSPRGIIVLKSELIWIVMPSIIIIIFGLLNNKRKKSRQSTEISKI